VEIDGKEIMTEVPRRVKELYGKLGFNRFPKKSVLRLEK